MHPMGGLHQSLLPGGVAGNSGWSSRWRDPRRQWSDHRSTPDFDCRLPGVVRTLFRQFPDVAFPGGPGRAFPPAFTISELPAILERRVSCYAAKRQDAPKSAEHEFCTFDVKSGRAGPVGGCSSTSGRSRSLGIVRGAERRVRRAWLCGRRTALPSMPWWPVPPDRWPVVDLAFTSRLSGGGGANSSRHARIARCRN